MSLDNDKLANVNVVVEEVKTDCQVSDRENEMDLYVKKEVLTEIIKNVITEENKKLKDEIHQTLIKKLSEYDKIIPEIISSIKELKITTNGIANTASNAYDTSDANLKSISELKNRVAELEQSHNTILKQQETCKIKVKELSKEVNNLNQENEHLIDKIDDIQNRNMRANLVFNGIAEITNENYDTTKELILNILESI